MKDKRDTANFVVTELSGLRAPTRVQTQSINLTLSAEEIAALKKRGLDAAGTDHSEVQEAEVVENETV